MVASSLVDGQMDARNSPTPAHTAGAAGFWKLRSVGESVASEQWSGCAWKIGALTRRLLYGVRARTWPSQVEPPAMSLPRENSSGRWRCDAERTQAVAGLATAREDVVFRSTTTLPTSRSRAILSDHEMTGCNQRPRSAAAAGSWQAVLSLSGFSAAWGRPPVRQRPRCTTLPDVRHEAALA
jgi:hypothetical protein